MSLRSILDADQQFSQRLKLDEPGGFWFKAAAFLAHSGDSWFWMAALIIIWVLGEGSWRTWAASLGFGIVAQALLVFAIKLVVRRRRPEGDWGAIYRQTDPHSFPSGHAARAALLAVLAFGLGPAWFAVVMLVWAPLVSLARVMMGVHYLSDILAGILVGIMMGGLVLAVLPAVMQLVPFLF